MTFKEMPMDVKKLIEDSLNEIKLNILVFGPQVKVMSSDERTRKLQNKRIDIHKELTDLGHEAKYAEELVDPNGPNALYQEVVIMREFDLIVILIDSPGSIVEVTTVALNPNFALKSQLFLDSDYIEGLAAEACRNAKDFGASFDTFDYPKDLDECHLLGKTLNRVKIAQKRMYMI